MAPRTRKTTNSPKKPAAKKTARPHKAVAPKTPPALAVVKPRTDQPTIVDHRDALPVHRRPTTGPLGANEQAAVRAALDTARTRLPIPVRTWNGSTAQLADGTLLTHNPGPDRTFTAHIACRHGAIHGWPINTHTDLQEARALTHACERKHAANTLSDNGLPYDWNKALHHGIQPTTRLAEGLITAKKATTATQELSADAIAAGLAARTAAPADDHQPKEHPQP